MPVSRSDCPPPGRAEQITTRIAYLVLGVGVSSWAALVPYAKARLGLDEAVLGMLLLCVGVGSLLSMPFTGLISGRFGCRKVILVSGFIFLAMLPLLASVESVWLMALCLFLFGASIGMMDVSLTIQAVFVEQAAGRAMMSGFHCLYSVGGICGAGGMALLLGFLAPHLAMLVICLFMIALLAAFGRHFLPYGSEGETPLFVVPRGIVLLIGVLCFIMYLSEGTILDWGALFMTAERGTEASRAGLAFACFSVANGHWAPVRRPHCAGARRCPRSPVRKPVRRRRVRAGGRRAVGMGFARRVYGGRSRRFEHRARAFLGYGPPEVHAPEPRRVGGDDHRLPRRACGSGAHGIRRPRHQPCDRLLYYTGADVLRGGRVSGRPLRGGSPSFPNQRKMFVVSDSNILSLCNCTCWLPGCKPAVGSDWKGDQANRSCRKGSR